MLYISRILQNSDRFGVVDTDDDTETVCTRKELHDAIINHKLTIEGIVESKSFGYPCIQSITPYQDMRYCTTLQTKMKVLRGVDIRTYKNEITAILPNADVAEDRMRIRLSDYGQVINWDAIIKWEPPHTNKHMILVLDDNIAVVGSEVRPSIYRFYWDITEVTNQHVIDQFYNWLLFSEAIASDDWSLCIIDNEERMRYYRCIGLLKAGREFPQDLRREVMSANDYKKNSELIAKSYFSEFESFANIDITADAFNDRNIGVAITLARGALKDVMYPFKLADYDELVLDRARLFRLLRSLYDLNPPQKASVLFDNYLAYFEAPTEVKQLYISMWNKFVSVIKVYCKEHNLGI